MMPGDMMSDDDVRDVVVRAPMSFEEARNRTDHVVGNLVQARSDIVELYAGRAHEALGYKSWEDYYRQEFHVVLRLDRWEKRTFMRELTSAGMTQRAVATTLGVDQSTVSRALAPDASASSEPPAGADQPMPAGPSCEACDGPLDEEQARTGYMRCEDCDSEGEHIGSLFPNGRGAGCVECHPELADTALVVDGVPRPVETVELPEPAEAFVPDRPADDWTEPAGAGVVESATPAGATDEAPGDADPDVEYRPWRTAAVASLRKARKAVYALTGDLLDVDTVAQRADDMLLEDLAALVDGLTEFLGRVRELRSPVTPLPHHTVWTAAQRKGTTFHRIDGDQQTATKTVCGRSMRAGFFMRVCDVERDHGGVPCAKCWPKAGAR